MTELNEEDIRKLVPWILSAQEDDEDTPEMGVEHWLSILSGEKVMTEADSLLLVMSPTNRARFAQAKHEYRRVLLTMVVSNDNRPRLMAAAASIRERIDALPMDDFQLYCLPHDEQDWMIVVKLISDRIPQGELIELIDEDNKIWLSGAPDNGKVVEFRSDIVDPRALIPCLKFRIGGQILD